MTIFPRRWLGVVGAFALCGCAQEPGSAPSVADTVYTNGAIYTVNEAQPWAEAVAVSDGIITVVG